MVEDQLTMFNSGCRQITKKIDELSTRELDTFTKVRDGLFERLALVRLGGDEKKKASDTNAVVYDQSRKPMATVVHTSKLVSSDEFTYNGRTIHRLNGEFAVSGGLTKKALQIHFVRSYLLQVGLDNVIMTAPITCMSTDRQVAISFEEVIRRASLVHDKYMSKFAQNLQRAHLAYITGKAKSMKEYQDRVATAAELSFASMDKLSSDTFNTPPLCALCKSGFSDVEQQRRIERIQEIETLQVRRAKMKLEKELQEHLEQYRSMRAQLVYDMIEFVKDVQDKSYHHSEELSPEK